ncbi:Heparan sulfate glucosamine 3-O-sulfotransferase 5 [Holothuria leucospilota]|uniref:Heparan sulfate glucosamine 3-O-sulfotransferase 5 n=1 Tax=Holothuria leucospilota TaxID=206669 RepID=A0A9Q1BUN3_HOLLE|nr:Heparan sulfate glucosamine 3-O-sulfotransferase 5 [Holothuria leucospilota]
MGLNYFPQPSFKGVFLAVLTTLTLLSLYIDYQGVKSNMKEFVTTPIRNLYGVSTNTIKNETTPKGRDHKNSTPAEVREWSRDQMWGCYEPSKRRLMLSRKLRSQSILDRLDCRKRAPDVLVVGVKKCGSQTLTGFLDLHPEIVGQYETGDRYNQCCVVSNRTKWIQYSPYSTPVEKTLVDVIKIADCIGRVKWILEEINPAMKCIVIIRDPYKRAVSDYKHLLQAEKPKDGKPRLNKKNITVTGENGIRHTEHVNVYEGYNIPSKFEYAVLDSNSSHISNEHLYISKGIYVNFMKQLIETVSRQNLLVIDGEMFAKDPYLGVKSVERFLGVTSFFKRTDFRKNSKGYFCPIIKQRPDSGCIPFKASGKNPEVSKSLQTKIKAFYRPYNRELENLLQQTFKWSH